MVVAEEAFSSSSVHMFCSVSIREYAQEQHEHEEEARHTGSGMQVMSEVLKEKDHEV